MENQNLCPICGSPLELEAGTKRSKCRYCGYSNSVEVAADESFALSSAFLRLRMSDFDEAGELFSDAIRRFPSSAEAYWGKTLSDYGIKYEDDYDGRKIPTCYAARYEPIVESNSYNEAIALADPEKRAYFESQAERIEKTRKEWVEKAEKEPPYDVFLSYKDTDNGQRTSDSFDAHEIYNILTGLGYRVFFSRVTLAGKTGENFEPYIFAALNSAPVMLVYASRREYIESTWVRNEWNRYLARIRDKKKQEGSLCVIFKDPLDPGKLPPALRSRQHLKRDEITFLDSLRDYVDKYVSAAKTKTPTIERKEVAIAKRKGQKSIEAVKAESVSSVTKKTKSVEPAEVAKRKVGLASIAKLSESEENRLAQAEVYLSRGDFERAKGFYSEVLSTNPHNPEALLGMLMVESSKKSFDSLLADEKALLADLDLTFNAIDYSEKDRALPLLTKLSDICLGLARRNEFAGAYPLYKRIAHYDVPSVAKMHKPMFDAAVSHISLDKAEETVKESLPFLSDDPAVYRACLEQAARSSFEVGFSKDASDIVDQYGQYFDLTASLYLVSLECKVGAKDLSEYLSIAADRNDFSLLSGELPLDKKEIDVLFRLVAEEALSMIDDMPEAANAAVRFLLPYRFAFREEFISKGVSLCQKRPNEKTAKVLDGFLHAYGDDSFGEFVSAQEGFVDACFAAGIFDLALHYLDRLIEYDPDKGDRYFLRACAKLGCRPSDLRMRIHFLSDYSDVELALANRGMKKAADALRPFTDAILTSPEVKEVCPVFDSIIAYLPKEEDASLSHLLKSMADACLKASLFEQASKYFSQAVTLNSSDHESYFGALKARVGAKDEEGVIHQLTPIGDLVEFENAKLATGRNRDALAHYIDLEDKQSRWIESEKKRIESEKKRIAVEEERKRLEAKRLKKAKARARRKRMSIIAASLLVVIGITMAVLSATIFVPSAQLSQGVSLLQSGDYDSAASLLSGNNFGEAQNVYSMAKAGQAFKHGDYESGIEFVLSAGGEVNVTYDARGMAAPKSTERITRKAKYIENGTYEDGSSISWRLVGFSISVSNSIYSAELKLEAMTEAEKKAAAEEAVAEEMRLGIRPSFSEDGKTVTYGMYPQSEVEDASTLASLGALASPEDNGWYLLDGEYYAKESGSWFAVEPIKWWVLERSGEECLLLSDVLLDAHRYNINYEGRMNGRYASNYANSEVRTWLNADFYGAAFALGDSYSVISTVDNSAATTESPSNPYACENTSDRVFLLSYEDYSNASYGFPYSSSRQCSPTDYAVAKGAYKESSNGNGCYWTRSPYSHISYFACYVGSFGDRFSDSVSYGDRCVRPSIRITVAE